MRHHRVGFWQGAVCDISPLGVVRFIRYGIDLVCITHIAQRSDYNGSTTVALDAAELSVLTQTMLEKGSQKRKFAQ